MSKVYNMVIEEFQKYDAELSDAFFDFEADNMTYRELLDVYKKLQKEINGDDLLFLDKIEVVDNLIISATKLDYEEYASFFNGIRIPSGMTAEQALSKIGKLCRIYRVFNAKLDNDTLIEGRVLDFLLIL